MADKFQAVSGRRSLCVAVMLAALGGPLGAAAATPDGDTVPARKNPKGTPPTVVLVHGAFADSSSWNGVIARLQAAQVPVIALTNPLRGLAADSAYVRSAIGQIPGPVLAVGHSYGGAVITNAASGARNVVGLVFVAAFAPAEGETVSAIAAKSRDSVLGAALLSRTYPAGANGATKVEFSVDPVQFREAFAADLPAPDAAVLAATQRPVSELAFSQPSGPAAWKRLPSWALIPAGDKAAGTDVLRSMASRAGATTVEVQGSHVILISKPGIVADLILRATETVR